jgi:hypothetical protein
LDHLGKLVEATKQVPFPVNFETHRGRLLFEPMSTVQYLTDLPHLFLAGDYSHWTCVTESMLGGFAKQMEIVFQRTRHIHARVGFEEGPQVPDPRVPMWNGYVPKFEAMWDKVATHRKGTGVHLLLILNLVPPIISGLTLFLESLLPILRKWHSG